MTMEFHSVQKLFETHQLLFQRAPPSTEKLANEVNFSSLAIASITNIVLQRIANWDILKFLGNKSAALPWASVIILE